MKADGESEGLSGSSPACFQPLPLCDGGSVPREKAKLWILKVLKSEFGEETPGGMITRTWVQACMQLDNMTSRTRGTLPIQVFQNFVEETIQDLKTRNSHEFKGLLDVASIQPTVPLTTIPERVPASSVSNAASGQDLENKSLRNGALRVGDQGLRSGHQVVSSRGAMYTSPEPGQQGHSLEPPPHPLTNGNMCWQRHWQRCEFCLRSTLNLESCEVCSAYPCHRCCLAGRCPDHHVFPERQVPTPQHVAKTSPRGCKRKQDERTLDNPLSQSHVETESLCKQCGEVLLHEGWELGCQVCGHQSFRHKVRALRRK